MSRISSLAATRDSVFVTPPDRHGPTDPDGRKLPRAKLEKKFSDR
jgi:hypothetical protein